MRLFSVLAVVIGWGVFLAGGSVLVAQEPPASRPAIAEQETSADLARQLALQHVPAGIVWKAPADSPRDRSLSPFTIWSMQSTFASVRPGRTDPPAVRAAVRQFAARTGAELRESPVYRITDRAAVTCAQVLERALATPVEAANAPLAVGRAVASAWGGVPPPGGLVGSCVSALPLEGDQVDLPSGLTLADALDAIVRRYPGSVWVAAEGADRTCSIAVIEPNEDYSGTCSVEVPVRLRKSWLP